MMQQSLKKLFVIFCVVMTIPVAVSCRNRPDSPISSVASSQTTNATESTDAGTTESSTDSTVESGTEAQGTINTTVRKVVKNTGPITVQKSFKAMSANDDSLMNKNPDRGFRFEHLIKLEGIAIFAADPDKMVDMVMTAYKNAYLRLSVGEVVTVTELGIGMQYYRLTGLDESALAAVDAILKAMRELGVKTRLAFSYSGSEGDVIFPGASEEVMLSDFKKLKPILEANKDVIYMFQAGFLGTGAEWAYIPEHIDKTKILLAIADIVPDGIYMSHRLPMFKNLLTTSHPMYARSGFNDDAFFGKVYDESHHNGSGGLLGGTDQWKQWVAEGAYAPNDGETYINRFHQTRNVFPEAIPSLQAFSEHRYTSFSIVNGYGDAMYIKTPYEDSALGKWKKVAVTEELLHQYGLHYAPNWFKDNKGNRVARNVFEYVRDYLGYRLEARTLKITGNESNTSVDIEMSLVNYGFSAAFNLTSGFAVLDSNGKVVKSVEAGVPTDWHPTAPANYANRTLLMHQVVETLEIPENPGSYRIAFYLKNELGQFARLANKLDFVNGYNVLHTVNIM